MLNFVSNVLVAVIEKLSLIISDVADIETHFPGLLKATVEWFKIYKIPDGKPENQFAFGGEAKPREFAVKVVDEVHEFWKGLVKEEVEKGDIST